MARATTRKNKKKIFNTYYDYSLLFLVLFLVAFGLIMIYSTSSFNAARKLGDAAYYLKRQALFGLLGIMAMMLISTFDYRLLIKSLPIIKIKPVTLFYMVCLVLQVLVLLIGEERNGSKRWLQFGVIGFQPSELSKVAIILFAAYIVYQAPRRLDKFSGFLRVMLFVSPLLLLVVIPNFSTGLIMGEIGRAHV